MFAASSWNAATLWRVTCLFSGRSRYAINITAISQSICKAFAAFAAFAAITRCHSRCSLLFDVAVSGSCCPRIDSF